MAQIEICPRYELAIGILGKRWTGLILRVLEDGPKRFSDVTDSIPGISAKVLTERMKELEEHSIVHRQVYAETPVRIEYSVVKMVSRATSANCPIKAKLTAPSGTTLGLSVSFLGMKKAVM